MGLDCTFHKQNPSGSRWKNYNKLRNAIRCQDVHLVKYLINDGVQVNGIHDYACESTPLHLAVISRCPEIVKTLLDHGASVNHINANWETPITLAAKIHDTVVLDLLLSYNVENHQRSDDLNHLHVACMRNKIDVIEKLLAKDNGDSINQAVSKNSIFWSGFTPLHFAVYYGCVETVECLLRCGANMMATDSKELTPLHWADLQRNEKIIDSLLDAHKNEFKNPVGSHGLTHFHVACTRDNPSIVEHFLKLGVNIDIGVSTQGYSNWGCWKPIHFATYYECPKVTELLLRFKADKKMTQSHSNLLEYTFMTENDTIYNLFIKDTIEPPDGFKDIERISDFHSACINDDNKFMELCLSEKLMNTPSHLDLPIWSGHTPLHLAVKCNSLDATILLLAEGASITVQDPEGKTPLHMAFENKHLEIINIIVQYFPHDIENVTDKAGLSFLHILCSTDKTDQIENILIRGTNANIQVGNSSTQWAGSTPMYFACKFKQKSVVELLLKYNAEIFVENKSIFDVFELVFDDDFFELVFLPDFIKVLFDMLMMIFSSSSIRMKYSNDCRISPLHALCLNRIGDLEMLKQYLITHKNEVDQTIEMPLSRRYHKCTPMHLAMRFHDFERAKLLIKAGANPLMEDGDGNTPIECAFLIGGPFNISDEEARILFPIGVPIETLKPSHFHVACCTYVFGFVDYVLSEVKDPKLKLNFLNCYNDLDQTPLHSLTRQGPFFEGDSEDRVQMIHFLLKNGANVNARDFLLQTPLHYADQETAMLLIQHGANVNSRNMYGETPLHIICKNFKRYRGNAVMTLLLENGADINIKDYQDQTCLMILNSFNDDEPSLKEFAVPILKQFIKLQTLKIHMDPENLVAYFKLSNRFDDVFDPIIFELECEDQIESMKLKSIDRYTTACDILFKSSNQMTFYCENSILRSICEPRNKEFSFYKFFLRLQIEKGESRKPLLGESKRSLNFLIGRSLPRICLERILDFLTDFEVKNIILSVDKAQTI